MPDTCVFCGRPIEPDQERSGRPPHAAHAACADAALASDAHWDAIASASGDTAPAEPPPEEAPAQERRAGPGCLVLVLPTLGVAAWLASVVVIAA
jgi:hypothetical protein